jgi:zinc transporter ZupT
LWFSSRGFYNSGPGIRTPGGLPPVENVEVTRILLPQPGLIVLTVINSGADPVTIAQVHVDEAYWRFDMRPAGTIPRLHTAAIHIPYPWVQGEPHEISLVTSTGASFTAVISVATQTPVTGLRSFFQFALIGLYVGVIPVVLGLMWHPFMRGLSRSTMDAILALTIGLLIFLGIETAKEGLEIAARVPHPFSGHVLFTAGALMVYLLIQIVGSRRAPERGVAAGRLMVSYLLALGIGLHNLAEGLAIGAAYAAGQAGLGAFLVVGFTLHNITEGVGIAAPIAQDHPSLLTFIGLTLIGGVPALIGAWIGGFIYSDLAAAVFLGVGLRAIMQVIVEIAKLLLWHTRITAEPLPHGPT